jgi:hypothetical protein
MLKAIGTIAIICLLVAFLAAGWYISQHALSKDLSKQPPAEVYQQVLGGPVPSGVSGVVVAGHSTLQTKLVWLKISAAPKTLVAISSKMNPIPKAKFQYTSPSALSGVLAQDAKVAGWDEVPTLQDPEYFLFRTSASSDHWIGTLVVSLKTHTAYVSASRE